jgi:N-acylglucosamine-6-phosphate 2-epimerase
MTTEHAVSPALASVRHRLVVSCQAPVGNQMRSSKVIARIAASVVGAGAGGVRIDSPEHIMEVKKATRTTIIGLWKAETDGVYITPTLAHARAVVEAGADIVAIDGTGRPRPDHHDLAHVIRLLHAEFGAVVLADVGTAAEGMAAAECGADAVATTLAGLTTESPHRDGPALDVVAALAASLDVPVIAEGGITSPGQARQALESGAWCVVIGKAITSPDWITARYVEAIGRQDGHRPQPDHDSSGHASPYQAATEPVRHRARPAPELHDGLAEGET